MPIVSVIQLFQQLAPLIAASIRALRVLSGDLEDFSCWRLALDVDGPRLAAAALSLSLIDLAPRIYAPLFCRRLCCLILSHSWWFAKHAVEVGVGISLQLLCSFCPPPQIFAHLDVVLVLIEL